MPKGPPRVELRRTSSKAKVLTSEQRKADKAFYKSVRWLEVRAIVLSRDDGLCQQCKRRGRTATGSQVDHIKPRKQHQELAFDTENLETLCLSCHNAKRRQER